MPTPPDCRLNNTFDGGINVTINGYSSGEPAQAEYLYCDPANRVTRKVVVYYDESETAQESIDTYMIYDDHGRVTSSYMASASGNLTTSYTYDGAGRKVSEVSPGGQETQYAYDGQGRMTAKIEDVSGIARTTGYEYNRLGQLVHLIAYNDTNTQTTTYAYDAQGKETSVTYPDSGAVEYAYNLQGKVVQRIDQRNITTAYEYDDLARLTKKYAVVEDSGDPNNPTPVPAELYYYDTRGLMIAADKTDGNNVIVADDFYYDGLGYLTKSEQTIGYGGTTYTVEYGRNQVGQATSVVYPYSSTPNRTLAYTYTSLGKINTISDDPNTLIDYDYAGSLVAQRVYDAVSATFTPAYDDCLRITSHVTANAGGDIVNFGYTYDADSNIISKQFNHRSGIANGYSYDTLDRVTGSDYHSSHESSDETFVYDTLGNRITHNDGADTVYAANIANEYTSIGGTAVSYDDVPVICLSDHRGYTYEYDYENRLTAIMKDSGSTTVATVCL